MKLDYDLVRIILLKLEEMIIIDDSFTLHTAGINAICDQLPDYGKGQILYTLIKLSEGRYIELSDISLNLAGKYNAHGIDVMQITFSGHQYLDSIRDSQLWGKIKEKTSSLTFSVISSVATKLMLNAIT